MGKREIDGFFGDYRFLTNIYPSIVIFEGRTYPTVEHAYQAAKTLDEDLRKQICYAKSPVRAIAMGKELKKDKKVRKDWRRVKLQIMRELLKLKFSTYEMRQYLNTTVGFTLINRNYFGDRFWGVYKGVGQNILGKMLMELRDGVIYVD